MPGGGGISATERVIHSPPDGYKILILSIANAVHPAMYKLKYDLLKSIEPVAMVGHQPKHAGGASDLPAKTVKEFIALAKAKPGDIQYASGGIGGSLHLGMENFKAVTKIDVLHVPFKGAGPGTIDVIAGNTKAVMSTLSSVSGHLKNEKLRGLGISSPKRVEAFPDIPTFIEAGVPEYEGGNWIGIGVPAGTPKAIIDLLNKEVAAIQAKPDVQKQMGDRGAFVLTMSPANSAPTSKRKPRNGARSSRMPASSRNRPTRVHCLVNAASHPFSPAPRIRHSPIRGAGFSGELRCDVRAVSRRWRFSR